MNPDAHSLTYVASVFALLLGALIVLAMAAADHASREAERDDAPEAEPPYATAPEVWDEQG